MIPAAGEQKIEPGDPLVEAARKHFGISYLYPIQRFVISNTLEGKDQIVVLPTGAGKSLCFQLPARAAGGLTAQVAGGLTAGVDQSIAARAPIAPCPTAAEPTALGPTVVVVPLLSLLEEQLQRGRAAGLRVEALRGGQSAEERARIEAMLAKTSPEQKTAPDLIFVTPESLASPRGRKLFAETEIFHFVVDEAHCVAEWGQSFRPSYLKLRQIIPCLRIRCLTAFTATASPAVLPTIREVVFPGRDPGLVTADPDRPNIRYRVIPVLSKARALEQIVAGSARPLLVFSRTRSGAEWAARTLRRRIPELESCFYHAGLDRSERARLESWFKDSQSGILACTSAYGMGLDKADIRTVVHLDIPYSPESYLQETGRAGRDGQPVEAILLYSAEDLRYGETIQDPLAGYRYLQMRGYTLDSRRCRREQLLSFLGEQSGSCSGCDVCDAAVAATPEGLQAILAFVSLNARRFTFRQAVHALRGCPSYEVVRGRLSTAAGFGALSGWQAEDIEAALEAMAQEGSIKVPRRGFWKDRVALGRTGRLSLSGWPGEPGL